MPGHKGDERADRPGEGRRRRTRRATGPPGPKRSAPPGGQGVRVTAGRVGRVVLEGGECFAAFVAHELRSPLAAQRALLELGLGDPGMDVFGWREIGEDVLGVCGEQERLLEACLVLARSRGRLLRCEPVDLAVVAAEALEAHDLGGLGRVVVLEPAWTVGDRELLGRLAANLVSNAVRHNVVEGRIEVATRTASRRVHLTVSNTGPLIAAAELECLFQPFQRLNSSGGSSSDGVGLGLAIVHAITDAHNATVTAQARSGGGVDIHVSFHPLSHPGALR